MTGKALVLGGGGAVGFGWQIGLLTGLTEAGIDVAGADLVIGTSAGSVVGACLSSGTEFTAAIDAVDRLSSALTAKQLAEGFQVLLGAMAEAGFESDPAAALRKIGDLAAAKETPPDEATFLSLIDSLKGTAWPERFRATAIDVTTGELRVWGPGDGIELRHGIASSCAAPVVFPPVTIQGRRYMDGGVFSHLNTAAATGADKILALACFPLTEAPKGMERGFASTMRIVSDEIDSVRATGAAIEAIEPSMDVFALLGGTGNMLDPRLTEPAREIGHRQAREVLDRVSALWQD